jgi:hypothetical protein
MSRYREIDLQGIRALPAAARATRVGPGRLAQPVTPEDAALLDRLPDQLGAAALRSVIGATATAARARRPVAVLAGGHVIKTGCAPCLVQLMERGAITAVALNGAAAIHDFELATIGATSEDVEASLAAGSFGMAQETAAGMNAITTEAARRGEGLGEALGRHLHEAAAPHAAASLLAAGWRLNIPVTVHVALGTDVIHQHPSADGAAIGSTSLRDFRILAAALRPLGGGVVLNFGSAVILPEVFLKALSVLLNLGDPISDLTTCDFDFIRHYRPMMNVVQRPTAGGRGRGYSITGHHEILIPLFTAGVLRELGRLEASGEGGKPQSKSGPGGAQGGK